MGYSAAQSLRYAPPDTKTAFARKRNPPQTQQWSQRQRKNGIILSMEKMATDANSLERIRQEGFVYVDKTAMA